MKLNATEREKILSALLDAADCLARAGNLLDHDLSFDDLAMKAKRLEGEVYILESRLRRTDLHEPSSLCGAGSALPN